MKNISRPVAGEYPAYYQSYFNRLPAGDELISFLEDQAGQLQEILEDISEARAQEAYAPGKWTIKELLQHMADTERIMAYRAMCISRGEEASLPGFNENKYVANSGANLRPLQELLDELVLIRKATIALCSSMTPEMVERKGTANNAPVSVRAILYIIAAHEAHHMHILQERYLKILS